MLMNVLTGVFDPPPAHLALPLASIAALGAVSLGAALVASEATVRAAGRPAIETIRDL